MAETSFPPGRRSLAWGLTIGLLLLGGCGDDGRDTTAPSVWFTFPDEYTVLSHIATVRVLARDSKGIKHVVFLADGDTLALDSSSPYTLAWNTTAFPDCTDIDSYVMMTAVAEDFSSNRSFVERRYFLDNRGSPPLPVNIHAPADITKHSARLSWDKSLDYNFSHYIVRRDTDSTVIASSDSIYQTFDPDTTFYLDRGVGVTAFGLDENTTYFYRVFVFDLLGLSNGSDSAAAVQTLLPQPVTLRTTAQITKYTIGLEWDASGEDVWYYRLHRGVADSLADLDSVAGLYPPALAWTDTGLVADSAYYYYLFMIDSAGYTHNFQQTEVIQARTTTVSAPVLLDPAPEINKYSATIRWQPVTPEEDVSELQLYRSKLDSVDITDVAIGTETPGGDLSIVDAALVQGTTYSYRLRHVDSEGNSAWSNTLSVTTQTIEDVYGTGGLGISDQGKYYLDIIWDTYNYTAENDFQQYTLRRDSLVLSTSNSRTLASLKDEGLTRATSYYYQLIITDTSGAKVYRELDAATRDIDLAEIVYLAADTSWQFTLRFMPSAEPAGEFSRYSIVRSATPGELFTDGNGDDSPDCLGSDCQEVHSQTTQTPTAPDSTFTFIDSDPNLVRLMVYFYAVLSYDTQGGYSISNIVGDTLVSPPDPVRLSDPPTVSSTTIKLDWTQASWGSASQNAQAFHSYEVWRNSVPGQDPEKTSSSYSLLAPIANILTTTYTDGGTEVQGGVPWYYTIIVRDNFGQTSQSNEVLGVTTP